MNKLKDKKNLIIISIILIIIVVLSIILVIKKNNDDKKIDTRKLDKEAIVKKQEEVTNLIKNYVDNISNIKEYARNNSKIEFSIKELRGIFNVDTSEFNKLKYSCNEDKTFIKYDNDYNNYTVMLDCEDFYLK